MLYIQPLAMLSPHVSNIKICLPGGVVVLSRTINSALSEFKARPISSGARLNRSLSLGVGGRKRMSDRLVEEQTQVIQLV